MPEENSGHGGSRQSEKNVVKKFVCDR